MDATLKKAQEKMNRGGDLLGAFVWWEAEKIRHSIFALPSKVDIAPPTDITAFTRAIQNADQANSGLVFTPLNKKRGHRDAYGVSKLNIQPDTDFPAHHSPLGGIFLDRTCGQAVVGYTGSMSALEGVVRQVRHDFNQHRETFCTEDITTFAQRSLNRYAIKLRSGMFYVPASKYKEAKELMADLEKIEGFTPHFFGQYESPEGGNSNSLIELAKEEISHEVAMIQKELDRMEKDCLDGKKVRESTLTKRIEAVRNLELKTGLVRDALSAEMKEMDSVFSGAVKRAYDLLQKVRVERGK